MRRKNCQGGFTFLLCTAVTLSDIIKSLSPAQPQEGIHTKACVFACVCTISGMQGRLMSEYTVLEAKLKACWSVGVFMFLHPFVFFLRVHRLSRVCVCVRACEFPHVLCVLRART